MSKTVGDYKLGKTLGEGSFSKVKIGTNIKTGENVAIKIIDRGLVGGNKQEEQVQREITIMGRMNHPGLIRLHAVLKSPKHLYLVLDLAEGGELFNKLAQDGPLSEDKARLYFQQLIDALSYMHEQGAIHRDLKPENLLLDKDGNLKIADFGLSILAQDEQMLKTRCGTPNYVAPEIFTADGYVGPPVDVWSAGVILYVMLAAALPFDAPTLAELARQIMNVQIKYLSSFPPGAVDLMKHIIVADPTKRYTIEDIRAHPWFNVNYHARVGGVGETPVVDVDVEEKNQAKPAGDDEPINAFELIARIGGVNMERLVDPQVPVNSSTTFSSNKKMDEIKAIIEEILQQLKATMTLGHNGKTFKCIVPVATGQVTVKISVSTVTGDTHLVEFCRLKGSQFDFLRVYRAIKQRLT